MNTKNPVAETAPVTKPTAKPAADSQRNIEQEGSIKIAELVENFKKYEGKTIQISGECVKINQPRIEIMAIFMSYDAHTNIAAFFVVVLLPDCTG